jgi:hypothetical protein
VSENNQLQELTALRAEYNKLCDELRYQDAMICALKEALGKISTTAREALESV